MAVEPGIDDIVDTNALEAIAANLDLREPNQTAVETIVLHLYAHEQSGEDAGFFEGVIDSAVGMGKTYVMAASMEYFAAVEGSRDFAVITPGLTILDKTKANFTPNHPKSLRDGMTFDPFIVTADNFDSAATRAVMDDPHRVKIYIFSVQSLLRPTTKVGRRTHKFQEGLGKGFYEHLSSLDGLVVYADEHHVYDAKKFSEAVRDLHPRALIGLTGTPTKKMRDEGRVIYRYPLAAAIAERYVKTPVIVGRKDDRDDTDTKLTDGARLLELKQKAIDVYQASNGGDPVNAVMLVVAQSIEEAQEFAAHLDSDDFYGGAYRDHVLEVHSKSADEQLKLLEGVEEPDSPVRIIVAVDKLKEGWDVKNVYVIASMRASVSKILTEQTLGRGLRLPFGGYTGVELLDTLEVLAHESYDRLLRDRKVFAEAFIDHRTSAVVVTDSAGKPVIRTQEETAGSEAEGLKLETETPSPGRPALGELGGRTARAEAEVEALAQEMVPRGDLPVLRVPRLRMQTVESRFSLGDITDLKPFEELGKKIASDPVEELRRTVISARLTRGPDGLLQTQVVRREAADRVEATAPLLPIDLIRDSLRQTLSAADAVPARRSEVVHLERILDAFLGGLGGDAVKALSAYLDRAAAWLLELIEKAQAEAAPKPEYRESVEVHKLGPTRLARPDPTSDRFGPFKRGQPYEGWSKSVYSQVWFDSSPEREVANILDQAEDVLYWVRLHRNDLPILWHGAGRDYNPDFVAVETGGLHLLIEVKSDRDIENIDVAAKADAARRWANYVNASDEVSDEWQYLLISETDIRQAKGSWPALRDVGR